MYKKIFEHIQGVDVLPTIGLLFFFVFFLGMIVWIIKMNPSFIKQMSEMPLEKGETAGLNGGKNHG